MSIFFVTDQEPPSELVYKEDTVKLTIALSRSSVEFFKREAAKIDVSYQKMIRRLLDEYVEQFDG